MPGFDGTGPRGMGPMTGGGRGLCAVPMRTAYSGAGYGMPYPYAAPWGTPNCAAPPYSPVATRQEELGYLKGLSQSLRDDLSNIEARMKQIESEKD